ncbi:MAG: sigma-54-dependent Fis family transcriptional regulator [Halobacteriovoraceae bacterium]|nr:sigma-54-dependent Fis family transcriptional regulator [Halobacteriovoraceae bacterium]MCB9093979.1 sigma-54-dependent Fis family transcriptional regulator [Halobacteriovoraceae bacterium]
MIGQDPTKHSSNLSQISTLLLSDLRENVFFAHLSKYIKDFTGEDSVEINLVYNDDSTQLIARDGESLADSPIKNRGEGACGYVTKIKRIYYSNSVKRDPVFASDMRDAKIEAEMIIPVSVEGKILATIHIQSFDAGKKYDDGFASSVKNLLNELSVPLQNINLYLMAKFLNKELLGKIKQQAEGVEVRSEDSVNVAKERIELIGHDTQLLQSLSLAKRVATQDIPVLIEGEAGVGKRLLAKKVHHLSDRHNSPFYIIECGTMNEVSLEKEIFGDDNAKGVLEVANHGTIVLNEVSELSIRLQSKILEFMTTGKIKKGSNLESIGLNVRIVATSQKSLKDLVAQKSFRDDLFYRLATVQIFLPALRERGDDIKILANHFLNLGKTEKKFLTAVALEELKTSSWSGNIIELRNAMERTYALSDGKYISKIEFSDFDILGRNEERQDQRIQDEKREFEPSTLADLEKRHICKTLEHLGGNKTRAAKSLGITVKTLYNKLHSYGLIAKTNQ